MRRIVRLAILISAVGAVVMISTSAWAQSGKTTPDFASHSELHEVADELEKMWTHQRHQFQELEEMRQVFVNLERRTGARPVPAARLLQGLGDEALLPMLWHLVSEDPLELEMDLRTWRNWRIGLVEAVGRIRDERSIPVLYSVVVEDSVYEQLRSAATAAIGRTGSVDAIGDVVDVAKRSSDRRQAIIEGLGKARRHNAAEYLLEVVQSSQEAEYHKATIRALGDWANQWAWETPALEPYRGERDKAVRAIIEVLVAAYPQADAGLATEIEKSLQLAGAQAAKERALARAADAEGEQKESFQQLAEVMANSPLE